MVTSLKSCSEIIRLSSCSNIQNVGPPENMIPHSLNLLKNVNIFLMQDLPTDNDIRVKFYIPLLNE